MLKVDVSNLKNRIEHAKRLVNKCKEKKLDDKVIRWWEGILFSYENILKAHYKHSKGE